MFTIQQFPFSTGGQVSSAGAPGGSNWPVIYLINNDTDIYIGETTSFERRFREHLRRRSFAGFTEIRFAFDGSENKSAILDYESSLIRLYNADGRFRNVLNANPGQSQDHDYHQRGLYSTNIQVLWDQLHALRLTRHDYGSVRNSSLYKFSPFTALTPEQRDVMKDTLEDFLEALTSGRRGGALISGGAGTGKSLLAVKIIDMLLGASRYLEGWKRSDGVYGREWSNLLSRFESYTASHGPLRIAYIAPQQSFNADMRKAFGRMPWPGGQNLVHNTSSIVTQFSSLDPFDIILVDETHRLKHRRGMGNDIGLFDENRRRLGLPAGATQLDVILARTRYACLFHDPDQSVKNSDITPEELGRSLATLGRPVLERGLSVQLRCLGGGDYVRFVDDLLSGSPAPHPFRNYDFHVYDDVAAMVSDIRRLDGDYGLCRTLAGFAWPWVTKGFIEKNKATLAAMGGINRGKNVPNLLSLGEWDITVGGVHFVWNIRSKGWVTSPGARDEIGCIHTSQGYDLNYCGLILGPDIRYNKETGEIEVVPEAFRDPFLRQHRRSITPADLRRYILNAYRTMLLRGIYGCYVYAVDDSLREYLKGCEASVRAAGSTPAASPEPRVEVPAESVPSPSGTIPSWDGEDPDRCFGRTVARLRRERGLSQEELAFRSGINRSYMGVIERGEKSPSLDTAAKVATGLGMSIGDLFSACTGNL